MKSRVIRQSCSALIYSLSAMMLFLAFVAWAMANVWRAYSLDNAQSLVGLNIEIEHEVTDYLLALEQTFPTATCTSELITALRMMDFKSTYLRGYEVVKDGRLECSSYWGAGADNNSESLTGEWPKGEVSTIRFPDTPSLTLYIDEAYNMRMAAGPFQATLRLHDHEISQVKWISQSLYLWDQDRYLKIAGNSAYWPSLDFAPGNPSDFRFKNNHWILTQCFGTNTCAVISLAIQDYFASKVSVLIAIVLVMLFMGTLAGVWGCVRARHYHSLNKQVARGMNTRQILCYYQPIIDMNSNQVTGCEVLCRWQTRDGELVMPDQFIVEVEKNNQTRELTEVVVTKAVQELQQHGLLGDLRVAINTFPDDIASKHIEELLSRLLPTEINSTFTVEITEKEAEDIQMVAENIRSLKAKGFQVAIDDFGTGYSNLQHLQNLQVDVLKIDKSFIWGVEEKMLRGSLVSQIVDMAKALDLNTVAEGVENITQYNELKTLGVTYSQGYLHARPMPIDELLAFVCQSRVTSPVRMDPAA